MSELFPDSLRFRLFFAADQQRVFTDCFGGFTRFSSHPHQGRMLP